MVCEDHDIHRNEYDYAGEYSDNESFDDLPFGKFEDSERNEGPLIPPAFDVAGVFVGLNGPEWKMEDGVDMAAHRGARPEGRDPASQVFELCGFSWFVDLSCAFKHGKILDIRTSAEDMTGSDLRVLNSGK